MGDGTNLMSPSNPEADRIHVPITPILQVM